MDHRSSPPRRFTLRDLAESLGVSKTTVSNAFSRPDQLSPALRDRVLEAARAEGYAGPDPIARMLRTGRAGALGLILPESLPFALDDPSTSELIRGIADACEERRLGLLVIPGASRMRDPGTITDVAVDGFVAYYLIRTAGGGASISVFENEAGTTESTKQAAAFIKENLPDVAAGPPQIIEGQTVIDFR